MIKILSLHSLYLEKDPPKDAQTALLGYYEYEGFRAKIDTAKLQQTI